MQVRQRDRMDVFRHAEGACPAWVREDRGVRLRAARWRTALRTLPLLGGAEEVPFHKGLRQQLALRLGCRTGNAMDCPVRDSSESFRNLSELSKPASHKGGCVCGWPCPAVLRVALPCSACRDWQHFRNVKNAAFLICDVFAMSGICSFGQSVACSVTDADAECTLMSRSSAPTQEPSFFQGF